MFLHTFNSASKAARGARKFLEANPLSVLNTLRRSVTTTFGEEHLFEAISSLEEAHIQAGRHFDAIIPDCDWSPDEGVREYLKGLIRRGSRV
jgi:hypothetical protein